jgi:hypothetical protein
MPLIEGSEGTVLFEQHELVEKTTDGAEVSESVAEGLR